MNHLRTYKVREKISVFSRFRDPVTHFLDVSAQNALFYFKTDVHLQLRSIARHFWPIIAMKTLNNKSDYRFATPRMYSRIMKDLSFYWLIAFVVTKISWPPTEKYAEENTAGAVAKICWIVFWSTLSRQDTATDGGSSTNSSSKGLLHNISEKV
jgi:hypothetical protein